MSNLMSEFVDWLSKIPPRSRYKVVLYNIISSLTLVCLSTIFSLGVWIAIELIF